LGLLSLIILVPFFAYVGWGRGLFFYAGLFSPLVLLLRASDVAYTTSPRLYWISLLAIQTVSWALLVYTGLRLRSAVAKDSTGQEEKRVDPAQRARAIGLGVWHPSKEDATPVEWLVYRQYGIHAVIWALGVFALACNAWIPVVRQAQGIPSGPFFLAVASPLGTVSGLIGAAIVGWVASRFFVGVRRSGDLELLMTTPVGAQSVVQDQWRVLKRLFVWPILCMQAPMLPQFLIGFSAMHGGSGAGFRADVMLLNLVTIANAFVGTAAVCWLGLLFGLRARTQAGAIVWTVGLGRGLPALFGLTCALLAGGTTTTAAAPAHHLLAGWIPELVCLGFYLWVADMARRRLADDLQGKPIRSLLETAKGA
jgi:hypothetical protein